MKRLPSQPAAPPSGHDHGLVMLLVCFVAITVLVAVVLLDIHVNRLVIIAVILSCPLVLLLFGALNRRWHGRPVIRAEAPRSISDKEHSES